jgi:hypothetical protein
MKDRIHAVLNARDGEAALRLLQEIADEYDLSPAGFENADQSFEGTFVESKYTGFCSDCATPYEVGETIFWRGQGRGVLCEGCRKAELWEKNGKSTAENES